MQNASQAKKHRRMLYQGMLVALPMIVNEISHIVVGKLNIPWGKWLVLFSWTWYLSTSPFVYLAFNSKLRYDVLHRGSHFLQNLLGKQAIQAISFNAAIIRANGHSPSATGNRIYPERSNKPPENTPHL